MVWSHAGACCTVRTTSLTLIMRAYGVRKIAEELEQCASDKKLFVIDAFAGVGGNAIAFASSGRWKRVYAIEKDPKALACARHNAGIYGVEHMITWLEGDCFSVIPSRLQPLAEQAILFASPPWGGESVFPQLRQRD